MAILIIEDEFLIAMEIRFHLEREHFGEIQHVATEADALAAIAARPWEAVVMDANLDGRGVEGLATALSARKIPFLVVTGYSREGLPGALAGAPVIEKPFQPDVLLEIVTQLCANSNERPPGRVRSESVN